MAITSKQLEEIKERANLTLPRYDANYTAHSQLDVMPLVTEIERLHEELGHLESAWQYSTKEKIYEALPFVILKIIKGEEWSI